MLILQTRRRVVTMDKIDKFIFGTVASMRRWAASGKGPWAVVLALTALLMPRESGATGFRIAEQTARALGLANAWVAQADDPGAVSINPAGLARLERPTIAGGFMGIDPGVDHTAIDGRKDALGDDGFYPPSFFAACNMGGRGWAFGIGVHSPFGLGTSWPVDGFARYASTKTGIQLVDVNPALAYRLMDRLYVGLGLDYYASSMTMERLVPWGAMTAAATGDPGQADIPDGLFRMKADGRGWGFDAGVLYQFDDRYAIGLAYRSPVKIDYSGEVALHGIGGIGLDQYRGVEYTTTGTSALRYPAVFQTGVSYRPVPALVVEADLEWIGWSSFDKLALDFETGLTDKTYVKNWKDTLSLRLGAEYAAGPAVKLRAGYLYEQSPVPDAHFDTLMPDGRRRHGFSAGAGYQVGRFVIDAAYMAVILTERKIDTPNPDYANELTGQVDPALGGTDTTGSYRGFTNIFSLNVRFIF